MLERDFQIKFGRWVKYRFQTTGAFELKLIKKPSMPYSVIEPHQLANLEMVKHGCLHFKIPDSGWQNPFDSFQICNGVAYLVVMFYQRGVNHFYMIDIDILLKEIEISTRKSLTEARAAEIGKRCEFA